MVLDEFDLSDRSRCFYLRGLDRFCFRLYFTGYLSNHIQLNQLQCIHARVPVRQYTFLAMLHVAGKLASRSLFDF